MPVGRFSELVRSYLDLRWHLDPVAATQAGLTDYDDRYGRFSPELLAPHLAALRSLAGALEQTSADTLDEEIDRTALLNEIRVTVARYEQERRQAKSPEFWLEHALSGLHYLLARQDRPPQRRAAALLGRLEDLPKLLDDAGATLTAPVRVFVETAQRAIGGGFQLAREAAEAVAEAAPGLSQRAAAAAGEAEAALRSFERDLDRWRGTADEVFAIGEEQFNFRLHYQYSLNDTAPVLHRYGRQLEREVERELVARARRLDAGRPWPELVQRLRERHPKAEELVGLYAGEMERAKRFVIERDLAPVPPEPLAVIPTPAFMRPLIPFAAYDAPGPYSSDRTGWFYVTAPDPSLPAAARDRMLRDHCVYEIGATALHEGYPGHHLQIMIAQSQPSEVRRLLWTALTGEGWALYCEGMMAEEGFYRGEEEPLFQQLHLLWRAVRIVLDVALHTRQMGFQEAVEYLMSRLAVDRANAEAEVRRYCAEPTYQLGYAVGRREILALRERYRAAKGSDFSLRQFHADVLRYGGLPVALIRWGLGLGE